MAILPIVTYPEPVLSQVAEEVEEVTDELKKLLDDMAETMYQAPGVGLAAPQVGHGIRAIVCDPAPESDESHLYHIINPKIVGKSGKIRWEEGCLSVPGITEEIDRASRVIVEGLDREGNPIRIEAEDLLAVILQHEIDHLNGLVFLDRLSRLKKKMTVRRYNKIKQGDFEEADQAQHQEVHNIE